MGRGIKIPKLDFTSILLQREAPPTGEDPVKNLKESHL
jgi:hypothetical protein